METQNNSQQNPQDGNESQQNQGQSDQQKTDSQQSAQQDRGSGAQNQQTAPSAKDIEENRAITYLSYLGLLFLVPMLVKKDSPFAQFHAKQGLVLAVAWFLGSFLVPVLGLGFLVFVFVLVLSIMGLVNVSKGEMKELPIVGDLAKKFNI